MQFLGDPALKNDFKKSHFKFLGRWIHSSLNERLIKEKVRSEFLEAMRIVSESQVRGFKKLWLSILWFSPFLLALDDPRPGPIFCQRY